jgi:hypothetical protein
MITAEYINELRKQVDRALERLESNPTHENEFQLKLLVTSLEARLRVFNRDGIDGMRSSINPLRPMEPIDPDVA